MMSASLAAGEQSDATAITSGSLSPLAPCGSCKDKATHAMGVWQTFPVWHTHASALCDTDVLSPIQVSVEQQPALVQITCAIYDVQRLQQNSIPITS